MKINDFYVIVKKNIQTSVPDADREIPTLGPTDNAGNSMKLFSGIIRLPSGGDRRPMLNCVYLPSCQVNGIYMMCNNDIRATS